MITEDHRNVSCGGDPFNYLKSVMKSVNIQLDPGEDAEILLIKEKFPYNRETFEGLARTTKLSLVEVSEHEAELRLVVRKPKA